MGLVGLRPSRLASLTGMLHQQLPWYVAGPLLGLCVVAPRLLFNGRLGVTGGYSDVIENVRRRSLRLRLARLVLRRPRRRRRRLRADRRRPGLPRLRLADRHLPRQRRDRHRADPAVAAGVLIGYGAKTRRRLHVRQRPQRQLDALARRASSPPRPSSPTAIAVSFADRGADLVRARAWPAWRRRRLRRDAVVDGDEQPRGHPRRRCCSSSPYLFLFFASAVLTADRSACGCCAARRARAC